MARITVSIFFCLVVSAEFANSQVIQGFYLSENIKADNDVSLVYKDTLTLPSETEFDLFVRMKPASEISAISLGFYFPEEYLEIIDIVLADSAQFYHYTINDSLFQLAWSNLVPISINAGDTLLTFKMKTLDISKLEGTVRLTLFEINEFADAEANIIDSVVLDIPEIEYLRPDTIDTVTGYYFTVYPNPFKDYTTVYFGLQEESKVTYSITDINGSQIIKEEEVAYSEGEHYIRIFGSDFAKGIYFMEFNIRNSAKNSQEIIKLISTY
jgi:hypothetical protein